MNLQLLNPNVQKFIKTYSGNLNELAFKGSPFAAIATQELLQQIKGYQTAKNKLPSWSNTENIIYPPTVNLEQTSSEITAKYKATLVTGKSLADCTGGFGVDTFYFSNKFEKVDYYEINKNLFKVASHNFKKLKALNIHSYNTDGILSIPAKNYDVIYIDPSRRNNTKGKVFFLSDCTPNLPKHIDTLMAKTPIVLVKTSPMLDLKIGISELKYVSQIHIIGIKNEVKELLWKLTNTPKQTPEIFTLNFGKTKTETFNFKHTETVDISLSSPKKYIYEPNAAILKSGGFNLLINKFSIEKLHPHSHLFTSDKIVNFPGRSFVLEKIIPFSKKEIKTQLLGRKANIATRNFPMKVEEIRKKFKIKDGGDSYLFFTTLNDDSKVVLVCKKLDFSESKR